MQIILALFIFLDIIMYFVFFDVILSWLTLLWIRFRPEFLSVVLTPIYTNIKKIIPTSFWPVDFTPIVVILFIYFIKWILVLIFPDIMWEINSLLK